MALSLVGCATTVVEPIPKSEQTFVLDNDEQRLWEEAREIDAWIAHSDALYENEALQSYLQSIMDELVEHYATVPDNNPTVRVLKSVDINAMMLPHGNMYVNTGMLAALESEAQLATVMGHELTHYLHRHGLSSSREFNRRMRWGTVLGVMLAGIGGNPAAAGQMGESAMMIWSISAMSGHSQDQERDADRTGLRLMTETGYDPAESVSAFENFLDETDDAEDEEDVLFFSSHPKMSERVANFRELLTADQFVAGVGDIGRDRYLEITKPVSLANIEQTIDIAQYEMAHKSIDTHLERWSDDADAHYFRGLAIVNDGAQADSEDEARKAYEKSAALGDAPAEVHRELGHMYRANGDDALAQDAYRRYLQLAPDAVDAPIVKLLLDSI